MREQGKIQMSCGFFLYFLLAALFLSNSAHATQGGFPNYTYTDEITGVEKQGDLGPYPDVYGNKVNIYYYALASSSTSITRPLTEYYLYVDDIQVLSQNGANYNVMSACPWMTRVFFGDHYGVCGIYSATLCDGDHGVKFKAISLLDSSYFSSFTTTINVNSDYCNYACPTVGQKGCVNSNKEWECVQLACCKANMTRACPSGSVCTSGGCNVPPPPPPPDVTPPATTASVPSDCQAPVNVSLACADPGSPSSGCKRTYYCWDDTNTCAPTLTYNSYISFNSPGLKYIRYYSVDNAGKIETPAGSSEVRVCNAKVELRGPANNTMANVSQAALKWMATGFIGNPDCELHFGASTLSKACINDVECNYTISVPDGAHSWHVICGGKTSQAWNLTVDTIPPGTAATAQNASGQYAFGDLNEGPLTIFLDCSDPVSGCARTLYCTGNSNTCPPASPYVGPILYGKSGTSYMNFYSVDKAGNYEQIHTVELRLAKSLPQPPPQLFCGTFESAEGFTPIMFTAAVLLFMMIGVVYMVGQTIGDPKLIVWCKVELVQGIISVIFIAIFLFLINSFCSIQVGDVASLVGAVEGGADYSLTVYQGAEDYLRAASRIAYASSVTARYYIGGVEIMASYSTWECPIWCFFSTGGTGTQVVDGAGAAYMSAGFGLLLNSSMMAMFSSLMHIFFLRYVGSGLFLMLLPIALIARSLPFLRNFGSLMLAVLFSFYVVYPLMLSAFYVILYDSMVMPQIPDENALAQSYSMGGWLTGAQSSSVVIGANDLFSLAGITAQAFMHGVFIPTLCLITATAAAAYAARLMGEELDLSRLTQMV